MLLLERWFALRPRHRAYAVLIALAALAAAGALVFCITWAILTAIIDDARTSDHRDPAACRRVLWALSVRHEMRRFTTSESICYDDRLTCQSTAAGLARTIAGAQEYFRGERGRYATRVTELIDGRLLVAGMHIGADGTWAGYAFDVQGDGTTWTLIARPTCPVCTVRCATFARDASGAWWRDGEPMR